MAISIGLVFIAMVIVQVWNVDRFRIMQHSIDALWKDNASLRNQLMGERNLREALCDRVSKATKV
jgi:hypothetical protein